MREAIQRAGGREAINPNSILAMGQRCLCWPTKLGSRPEARIPTRPVTKDTPAALAFANVQCPLSWNAASGTLDSSGSDSRTAYWGWVSETQLTTPGPKCAFGIPN